MMKKKCKVMMMFLIMVGIGISSVESFAMSEEPVVLSEENETGIKIIKDAAGGIVISGLNAPIASASEQKEQLIQKEYLKNTEIISQVITRTNYYDTEYNPIYIGTWDGTDAYARHTLGEYYNGNPGYLLSYGDCSWYNTSGYSALPYRNGAATVSGQAIVDVKKGSYFDIRDLGTDNATTLKINDWGPDQIKHPNRIADIDKNVFKSLHGNTSIVYR